MEYRYQIEPCGGIDWKIQFSSRKWQAPEFYQTKWRPPLAGFHFLLILVGDTARFAATWWIFNFHRLMWAHVSEIVSSDIFFPSSQTNAQTLWTQLMWSGDQVELGGLYTWGPLFSLWNTAWEFGLDPRSLMWIVNYYHGVWQFVLNKKKTVENMWT